MTDDDFDFEFEIDIDDEPDRFFVFDNGERIALSPEQHARPMLWFVMAPEMAYEA